MRRPRCGTEQKESPRREAGNRDGRTRKKQVNHKILQTKVDIHLDLTL